MEKIQAAIAEYDEDLVLKNKQEEALHYLLNKKGDLIVNLPVGYGKSLIYHLLPKILDNKSKPVALVLSPLDVIQKDQFNNLKLRNITSCRLDICAKVDTSFDSDISLEFDCKYDVSLDKLKKGEYSIVLTHPEALLNTHTGKDLLSSELQDHVVAIVIDECHVIENWGAEFRKTFSELKSLRAFFPEVPLIALSGTLTQTQKISLPKQLGLINHNIIEETPDRPNIYLKKVDKGTTADVEQEYESVTVAVCERLFNEKEKFPVTLLFIPVHYMSQALMFLNSLFRPNSINDSLYSAICSGQDKYVINRTMQELKKTNPQIRLVLTTSIIGMVFDPENVSHVIHACPPRNLSQYFQEIGRAGRRGQPARATLFYSSRNLARNLPGITDDIISYCRTNDCLRNKLLSVFGFNKDVGIVGCKCCSSCSKTCTCQDCFAMNIKL